MSARHIILLSTVSVLLLPWAAPSVASEPPFLLGASVALEASMEGDPLPVGELLGRYYPSPTFVLEAALSYRHSSYQNYRGTSGEALSITQEPVLLGARRVLGPTRPIRVLLGGGLHVSPTRLSSSSYIYSYSHGTGGYVYESDSRSTLVVGLYLGLDTEARLGKSLRLLSGIRYVFNPTPQAFGNGRSQDYLRLFLGGGTRL